MGGAPQEIGFCTLSFTLFSVVILEAMWEASKIIDMVGIEVQ